MWSYPLVPRVAVRFEPFILIVFHYFNCDNRRLISSLFFSFPARQLALDQAVCQSCSPEKRRESLCHSESVRTRPSRLSHSLRSKSLISSVLSGQLFRHSGYALSVRKIMIGVFDPNVTQEVSFYELFNMMDEGVDERLTFDGTSVPKL